MIRSKLWCLLLFLSPAVSMAVEEVIIPTETQVLGGWNKLPLQTEKADELKALVELWYNRQSDSPYLYKAKGVNARMQVTDRINYELKVIMIPTGCLKDENENCLTPSETDRPSDAKVEKCVFRIEEARPTFKSAVTGHRCMTDNI
ncbi:Hypothetical predicted protein [Pelobates cultripes]|uniref:Cystatin domain-containing protein n=1 Tax=Pelobates cultripes TaxID=61616 RepID=A0AAD1TI37_PELCU|nr:Hypothetical predicted protein [Pelobates cultripes]